MYGHLRTTEVWMVQTGLNICQYIHICYYNIHLKLAVNSSGMSSASLEQDW